MPSEILKIREIQTDINSGRESLPKKVATGAFLFSSSSKMTGISCVRCVCASC